MSQSTVPYEKRSLNSARRWEAVVLHCPDAKHLDSTWSLDGTIVIGREVGDYVLADAHLSRKHVTLKRVEDGIRITDHATTNGTFVDGRPIEAATVTHACVLRVGDTLLEVAPVDPRGAKVEPDATLVGRSGAMRVLLGTIDRIANKDLNVLIIGETGTGKELVAQRLHEKSGRPGELVAVNCGAIPENLVESTLFGHKKGAFTGATEDRGGFFARAHGGTLFLDEIGELPSSMQPKLLRAIENREYTPVGGDSPRRFDGRFIAATHVPLREAIADKRFREDLYARLNDFTLTIPPLRERRRDIPLLVRHVLEKLRLPKKLEVSAACMETLLLYEWPMNIRQLQSTIKRAALAEVEGDVLDSEHLPEEILMGAQDPEDQTSEMDAERLASVLSEHGGNVAQVARALGKPRSQLYRWLKRFNLSPEDYRDG